MLMSPIQAHSCMFARAPVHACAPASSAHPLLHAICSHAISRVFQEPKTLSEYKHFEPSDPLNPSPGKNTYFLLKHRNLKAGLFLALPRCAPSFIASSAFLTLRYSPPPLPAPPAPKRATTELPPPAPRQPQDAIRTDAADSISRATGSSRRNGEKHEETKTRETW
jgi:hypothetical protein